MERQFPAPSNRETRPKIISHFCLTGEKYELIGWNVYKLEKQVLQKEILEFDCPLELLELERGQDIAQVSVGLGKPEERAPEDICSSYSHIPTRSHPWHS